MTADGAGLTGTASSGRQHTEELEPGQLAVRLRRFFFGQAAVEGCRLPEEFREPGWEEGGTEVETLVLVAPELGEGRELLGGLDTLGDHFEMQAVGERDDRPDD